MNKKTRNEIKRKKKVKLTEGSSSRGVLTVHAEVLLGPEQVEVRTEVQVNLVQARVLSLLLYQLPVNISPFFDC